MTENKEQKIQDKIENTEYLSSVFQTLLSVIPNRVFVAGTDTDIGKTFIAAMLTAGLRAIYWKPVQSGTREGTDTDTVKWLTGLPDDRFLAPAYALKAPLSPHLAAARENVTIALDAIKLPTWTDTAPLVVEGAGGLMVPLNSRDLMIDLIKQCSLPVILVASNRLGTINQTLLSLEALHTRHIPVAGVILNRGENTEHDAAIERFGRVPVLARIPEIPFLGPNIIEKYFIRHFTVKPHPDMCPQYSIQLAEAAINDRPLSKEQLLEIVHTRNTNLPALFAGTDLIRRHVFQHSVHLCTICNAKSGNCSEDCRYCAQSAHYQTDAPVYPLLPQKELVKGGDMASNSPVHRYSIVTSGRRLPKKEIPRIAEAMGELYDKNIGLCASLGILDRDDLTLLQEAGMTRYHHNLETAASLFPSICTTHTYDERIATIRIAKEIGLSVCSGGIFGLGETDEQAVEFALTLRELDVDAVPINFLIPIQGTPMENAHRLTPLRCLKLIALFRFTLPTKEIIICGGRMANLLELHPLIFQAGASGIMTGNYLTRKGRTLTQDLDLLQNLQLEVRSKKK